MKVSVIGATGYTGAELVKILLGHPGVELGSITSQSFAGKKISEVYPYLDTDLILEEIDLDRISSESILVFVALPHSASMEVVGKLCSKGKKVIDLSADFRLTDPGIYEKWYKATHTRKELLKEAVYGLPEIYGERIRGASLVANPGCYPTSIILALAPLIQNEIIEEEGIIIDAKSGVSGAGRKLTLNTHYPEINESLYPYQVEGHRHIPEMEQELSKMAGKKINITFVPHLVPLNRGIISTCYATLRSSFKKEDIFAFYKDFYEDAPFVQILSPGEFPHIKDVIYSNRCRIGIAINNDLRRIIVISSLDNLVKGASGQAVQNMNLMLGLDEKMGLL
ncbi:N-acetyl-gamma-glutamyl-phosphate reductase [Candidatus Aerophobetes bacterium]|uniref:N-acetyl-gamma-glutamyl-phosphate reductase n=1 Tax=Aerophobetes bacterium TaxID=2030807 RepID=A0A523TH34_UNCAE|nr:MAG: N-acetyl-gamma-glutamyl-phosphate reductase [Candidatus Aerophobetes bacterium]